MNEDAGKPWWARSWPMVISIGSVASLVLTHIWAYSAGATSGEALLIDTMSQYRAFLEEVRENAPVACDSDAQLKGLYLSQYRSMLPVIGDEIEPPYDNPCPTRPPAPPEPPSISFCQEWDTWEEYLADPSPSMSLSFGDNVLIYPLGDQWRNAILEYKREVDKRAQEALENCPKGSKCEMTLKMAPQEDS